MRYNEDYVRLVEEAQLGDNECLNRLAEAARVRLSRFVFRLTLREDLTQDIVQETILEMLKVFGKLKKAERFWSWLYSIAFNKVRIHYDRQRRHRTILMSQANGDMTGGGRHDALAEMVSRELKEIVQRSIAELEPRHTAVLTMRCYDEMSYAEIAESLGCSEFGVRVLFYRAKKALARKLGRHGLTKECLLPALLLFGKMTAGSEAAAANVSVAPATIKVGVAASLAAVATSKASLICLAAAGVIAAGSVAVTGPRNSGDSKLPHAEISPAVTAPKEAGESTEECWYFFPEGPGKALMVRLIVNDSVDQQPYCQCLQNEHANFYYDKGNVYIRNHRMYNADLSVRRLPTDSAEMSQCISRVEGAPGGMEYLSDNQKGLLVICKRNLGRNSRIWQIDRHLSVLDEEYFQFDWVEGTSIIDNRDAMHKRGWTYFRIDGHINNEKVSGIGRIPFVYATRKQHYPWLNMRIGDTLRVVDNGAEACVYARASGKSIVRYAGGTFFKGLGRPWMGLHTVDTVRRDAAEKQVWFETRQGQGREEMEVVLTCEQAELVYTIHMEKDVIEKITFLARDGRQGELTFSYLQEMEQETGEFAAPRRIASARQRQNRIGMLWLVKLAEGKLLVEG